MKSKLNGELSLTTYCPGCGTPYRVTGTFRSSQGAPVELVTHMLTQLEKAIEQTPCPKCETRLQPLDCFNWQSGWGDFR